MIKYVDVYPWDVLKEVQNGRRIRYVDKKSEDVWVINDLDFEAASQDIKTAEENPGRYVFWYEEETKTEETKVTEGNGEDG